MSVGTFRYLWRRYPPILAAVEAKRGCHSCIHCSHLSRLYLDRLQASLIWALAAADVEETGVSIPGPGSASRRQAAARLCPHEGVSEQIGRRAEYRAFLSRAAEA